MQCHSTNKHSRSLQEVCKKQTVPNKLPCTAHWPWSTGFFINLTQLKLAPSVISTINQLASCMPSSPTYRRTKSVVSSRTWAIYLKILLSANNKVFLSNARCIITYMYVCMDFDHPWSLTHPYISLPKLTIPSPNPMYALFHVHILAYITLINYTLFLHTSPWSYPIQCLEKTIARHLLAICTEDVPVVQSCIVVMITSALL